MKIGIFTALFHDMPIEKALDIIEGAGIKAVEFGGGAYPGTRHLDDVGGIQRLIEDEGARKRLLNITESRGLEISAISVHGNPIHPNKAIAQDHHNAFRNAVLLAEKLGLGVAAMALADAHQAPVDRTRTGLHAHGRMSTVIPLTTSGTR